MKVKRWVALSLVPVAVLLCVGALQPQAAVASRSPSAHATVPGAGSSPAAAASEAPTTKEAAGVSASAQGGGGVPGSGNVGLSLLGVLGTKPRIQALQEAIKSRLVASLGDDQAGAAGFISDEQAAAEGVGVSTPLQLSAGSAYVPPGSLVHAGFSRRTCPLAGIELINHIQHEMTPLQCADKCRAQPGCEYYTAFQSGSCALFSACTSTVRAPESGTTYALAGHDRYSKEQHAAAHRSLGADAPPSAAATASDPYVSHLWRLNKRPLAYYVDGPDLTVELPRCIARLFEEQMRLRVRRDTQIPELGVDHVYMVHYTPLVRRRAALTRQHLVQGVSSDWVTSFDHQNVTQEGRACLHTTWEPHRFHNPLKKLRKVPSPNVVEGGFRPGELSVNTKHHFIYHDIVRHNYTFSIVLEDDAKLRAGFRQWFVDVMKTVPEGFDIVAFGGCLKMYGWRAKAQAEKVTPHVYRKAEARCAHAYAVTLAGAKKLLASMPITDVIDYQINRAIKETDMKVYWIEPWLAVQGPVGEAGQPRKTATTGGDGEPFNPQNAHDPTWIDTFTKPVPPQPKKSFKVPPTSSHSVCVGKDCWWL